MCGRYSLKDLPEHLKEIYRITGRLPDFPARYNIAPAQYAPVIGYNAKTDERSMVEMRWELVRNWAPDDKSSFKTINARAENVATLKSFKDSFRRKRCIVPASGFYEWKREGKERQPYYFQLHGDRPLGFAGIWATWEQGESKLRTFSIIITSANKTVSELHDRMPVILPPHCFDAWLDPDQPDTALQDMLAPYSGRMQMHPLSKEVNKVGSEGEKLAQLVVVNNL